MEIQQSCPFAISTVTPECIINARRLTHGDDIKETYSVELSNKVITYDCTNSKVITNEQNLV